ncbi:MAG: rubrerythrin family protein [Anaerolineae bacterium]|nr:rubrerythrin family protein [Anaerolineae bacterium]
MRDMTRANMQAAFAGESQAHLRYSVFADKAEREGLPNTARLFRAASLSEQIHASNHLRALGGVGSSAQNLETAQGGEDFEIAEMYPAYVEVAKNQEEAAARRSMEHALAAEKVHSQLYGRSREAVAAGKDVELETVYVCEHCGFTMEGEAPDRCPVCGASHTRFRKF